MIELADQLAERQLREGTASAQVLTHYLKLGSSRERKEQAKLELETELVRAKTDQISEQRSQVELFERAIKAMRSYQGVEPEPLDEEEFE
jgi:DNA-binding ferritin-like protein